MTIPTDLSGLTLWLDGSDADTLFKDAGTTKVTADGDAVYQWNDKSGAGRNFIQATLAYRPLYKTNILGGKSCALFDGANDRMAPVAAVSSFIANNALTIIAVIKAVALDTNNANGYDNDNVLSFTYYGGLIFKNPSGSNFHMYNNDGNTDLTAAQAVSVNTPYILSGWHSGGYIYAGINANTPSGGVASGNTADLTGSPILCGSHGYYANLYVMELAVYNVALSDANRNALIASLDTKWGITPPTGPSIPVLLDLARMRKSS